MVPIHPLVSPWGRFGLYSFFLDAPEPAIVDTGIASSPAEGMAPALEALGRRIEDVRWILLTHGHIDHVGGAHALWELTGRRARVVISEADAPLLRSRRAHVQNYLDVRARYLSDPEAEAKQTAMAAAAISGELEPHVLVRGGETLSLGGGVTVSVHAMPGHTAGSVAYVVDGQDDVFVGDAVQVHGAANGFPGFEDPRAYRASLEHLRDVVRPRHLYLGHPYRTAGAVPYGVELDREQAQEALRGSLDIEARVADAASRYLRDGLQETDSAYSPFARVAEELGYTGDPTLEPSPFFTTLHGYRKEFRDHG
jgi:glyoxylase-like metal-dependent hydrolase (beta-lactamase superfamily II)